MKKLLRISIVTLACKDGDPHHTIRTKKDLCPRLTGACYIALKRKGLCRRTRRDVARCAIRTQFNLPINTLIGRAVS